MVRFLVRRLLEMVPLVLLISVVCFALMHMVPGGPAAVLGENPKVGPEDIARIRSNFGLDQPLPIQYAKWLERVLLHGDFGFSYVTGEPVLRMIARRVPATLELVGAAFLLALVAAFFVGIASALKPGGHLDSTLTVFSLGLLAVPVFWSGLMAISLFAVKLRWLPAGGMLTLGAPPTLFDHLRHLVLPSVVLSLVLMAGWSRYLRDSLRDAMSKPHIDVARAKGLSRMTVVMKHALLNALAPFVAVVALNLPLLFTGAVITETVFSWPGIGRLFYEGLLRLDYTRLMAIVFIASILIAVFKLIADIVHGILDPRIRYAR
jgi:peptide/nickel transport system permease protein